MNPPAKISDLMDALLFDSPEHVARFDRQTGRLVSVERSVLSAVEEGEEKSLGDLPEWQKAEVEVARAMVDDSGERFIHPPDRFEFHEYHQMERFIGSVDDVQASEQLWRAIKGKGAFRYFKDTAARLGLLDQWYQYRDEAMRKFVIDWAEANHVPIEDDTGNRGS